MWPSRLLPPGAALVVGVLLGVVLAWAQPPGPIGPLPAGRHVDIVAARCIVCHGLELVAQQRQDRAGWQVIVDRMDTYGVPIPPEDKKVILDYLSEHLGP
jgi:hypothetical protein